MRIFVAGATGVIGRPLVKALVAGGHTVIGMTRRPERATELRATGAEAVVCDVFDAPALTEALKQAHPDAVIHQLTEIPQRLDTRKVAAQLAPTNRLRDEGTRNLVAAAQAAGARRLIAQSIAFVYAPTGGWVKDESAPLNLGAHGPGAEIVAAVASLERQVLAAGGLVLRYGYFYGPASGFAPGGGYATMAKRRMLPVVGSGAGVWSFIHVDDAVSATVAALTRGAPGVYNVVDDEPAPARAWVPVFVRAAGGGRAMRVPAVAGRIAGGRFAVETMTIQRGASNAKARAELGWAPAHRWRDELAAG